MSGPMHRRMPFSISRPWRPGSASSGGGGGGPGGGGTVARPAWNTGTGFFVLDGKLYDANGVEFRIRGVNRVHWDSWSAGLEASKANACRWLIDFTRPAATNVAMLQTASGRPAGGSIVGNCVVIPGNWEGTCHDETSYLTAITATWVAQATEWRTLERWMILNIANEWGPGAGGGTTWRDANITAIAALRAAGYKCTISVTAGGCGQEPSQILNYGQAVFDSDPQKNVIFDQHIYGNYSDLVDGVSVSWDPSAPDITTHFQALKATGLVVHIGEFGPGRNIGPSPTLMRPRRVMQVAEEKGLGWLAWAWDDNNLAGGLSDDDSFSMSYTGNYASSSDLTIFGKVVVEDPTYGLKVLAQRASIFT